VSDFLLLTPELSSDLMSSSFYGLNCPRSPYLADRHKYARMVSPKMTWIWFCNTGWE